MNPQQAAERREYWRSQPWATHTTREIAAITGANERTVRDWRRRVGVSVGAQSTVPAPAPSLDAIDSEDDSPPPTLPTARPNPERALSTRDFATPEQVGAIDALMQHGSVIDAAEALGITPWRLRWLLSEAERRAARRGWSPPHGMDKPTPDGFHVRRMSTYYGADGEVRGKWVIANRDAEHQLAQLLDAVQAIAEPMRGLADPVPSPVYADADLLSVYPMGDPHFGLLAWDEETGSDNFDLETAERLLFDAADHLVQLAPPSELGIVLNLGDYFNSDNKAGTTTSGKVHVDSDSRWGKVMRVGTRCMKRVIDRALEKHKRVRVINNIGNHDGHASIVLSLVLDAFYSREPRVEIDMSQESYNVYEFGKCMITSAHGDKAKGLNLAQMIAARWPEAWGRTKHRHCYMGHVHHDTKKEHPGITLESFRTLAARDAWHAGQGYMSGRDMKLDVWHREYGYLKRDVVGVGRLCA